MVIDFYKQNSYKMIREPNCDDFRQSNQGASNNPSSKEEERKRTLREKELTKRRDGVFQQLAALTPNEAKYSLVDTGPKFGVVQ